MWTLSNNVTPILGEFCTRKLQQWYVMFDYVLWVLLAVETNYTITQQIGIRAEVKEKLYPSLKEERKCSKKISQVGV